MRSVCVSGNVGTANFEYLLYTVACELLTALLLRGIFAWLSFGGLEVACILLFGRRLWVCFEVCVDVLVMHTGLFTSRTTRAPVVRALVGGRIEAAV